MIKYKISLFFDWIYSLFHDEIDNLCFSCLYEKDYPECASTKWRFSHKGDAVQKCNGYEKR